jgi:hypothetical protein
VRGGFRREHNPRNSALGGVPGGHPPPEAPFDDLFATSGPNWGVMTHFLDPRDELGVTFRHPRLFF